MIFLVSFVLSFMMNPIGLEFLDPLGRYDIVRVVNFEVRTPGLWACVPVRYPDLEILLISPKDLKGKP